MSINDLKFEYALQKTLSNEGGHVDDQDDNGGATNYGVSLRFLADAGIDIDNNKVIDSRDIERLSVDGARFIYKKYWWDKYKYFEIDDFEISAKVFDLSINIGPTKTAKIVQNCVNKFFTGPIKVDGILGEQSYNAVNLVTNKNCGDPLLQKIKCSAIDFYIDLAKSNTDYLKYLKGWVHRAQR